MSLMYDPECNPDLNDKKHMKIIESLVGERELGREGRQRRCPLFATDDSNFQVIYDKTVMRLEIICLIKFFKTLFNSHNVI